MGIEEYKTYVISCDRCPIGGPIVHAARKPSLPEGWSWHQVHDCGMTGYTRTEALCWNCTQRVERESVTASRKEGGTDGR